MSELSEMKARIEADKETGLLPCAHCEGKAVIENTAHTEKRIKCTSCGLVTKWFIITAEAITAWNTRPQDIPRLSKALEVAVASIMVSRETYKEIDRPDMVETYDELLAQIASILKGEQDD